MIMSRILKNKSGAWRLALSKKVSQVVASRDIRNTHLVLLNTFTHEEVPAINMFHAPKVLRVVSHFDSGLVVHMQVDRLIASHVV